ncbi:MAG: PDZ domain-containing protein [Gemmatimonadota bacterium]|nr:MAG: PDZ domain-containing protein [Gemmatimonadota bacterium]
MRWASLVLAGALLVGVVVVQPARAQEEKEECVCPSRWGRVMVWPQGEWTSVIWAGGRARLGIWVHTEANPETDSTGALVDRVAEGGPAEVAGIREGDIITRLDGQSLLQGTEEYDEDESAPGMRLVKRARELEVGDTVEVELRRGGETRTVQLVVGEFEGPWSISIRGPLEEQSRRLRALTERYRELPGLQYIGPESFALRLGARLPGLELVSLNPDLGEYFGVDEGVLVVSVPEDSELGLRAGDVILAIDGREVKSPSHAMRILRSYNAEEEVSFRIMRQKSERTVEGKVPEALDFRSRVLRIERR